MQTRVIYRDGKIDIVDASSIEKLRNEGKIFAYQVFHRWVEVKRNQSNPGYQGPERRRHGLTPTSSL